VAELTSDVVLIDIRTLLSYGSVLPAAWSLCLPLPARGFASA
jgi:hypothetical protein